MKKKKENSYFAEIFMNMLLTLIVPFVIIIMLCIQTESTIKKEILLYNKRILNNVFQVLDMVFEEIRDDEVNISLSQECSRYVNYASFYPDKMALQALKIKELLADYWQDEYLDLFVYYPYNDKIVSRIHGSSNAETYYQTHYADDSYDYSDEFNQMLACEKKRPEIYVMNRNGETPYLCLAMRKTNRNPNADYIISVILRPEYLKKVMYTDDTENNGTLLILDENQNLLLCGDCDKTDYYLTEYDTLSELYEIKLENGKAMMQVQKSECMDIYYAFATPSEYFWQEISKIRLVAFIYVVLCICTSILWAYWNTKKTYKPMSEIMQYMQAQYCSESAEEEINEFAFIETLLTEQSVENRTLKTKLRQNSNMKKEHFLTSIIAADPLERDETQKGFQENGIQICSDKFIVAAVKTTASEKQDIEAFVIKNVFEEMCNRIHEGYVVNLFENRYAILINLKKEIPTDTLLDVLYEGQHFLEQYGFYTSIGIGEVKAGMMLIHQSYQEAMQALKYTYLLGENTIIEYREICNREFQHLTSNDNMLLKRVLDYVKGKDCRTAREMISEILEDYGINENVSIETVECFLYEIVGVINRIFMLQTGMEEQRRCLIEELMAQPTLETFEEKLISVLLFLQQEEASSTGVEEICQQALHYIEEHYMDVELSVSMLGERLQISSVYLSKEFKKKYEITLLNYIAQVRIQNAKEALADQTQNIKDIAEKCGFLSSNVFIKTFKKYEGVTPGMYRELLEKS